ncbi:uncharacterized protein TRAVEDRAFT_16184 [Trametes versicolor FP-101664 SS1]|uniref:uncharacterized protein n=1 Tax=Trametes versicolor (strain FP-101664) TaxID=717944 RepID=UPI000462193E|nr:uncharacterized protein TRAVEDRAFT_16184 [Trametes versicolor FP-101664 SS1]EIW63932.1 hypothetical protein TRAVEDRAFT_16184 [Trametes versicolor FP-101664 SS1]
MFLTPTIRGLELASNDLSVSTVVPLFAEVVAVCRDLTHLQCTSRLYQESKPAGPDGETLTQLLRGMPKLEKVLATLPKLATLELTMDSKETDALAASAAAGARAGRWFNTLVRLGLAVEQMDQNTAVFLCAVRSGCLRGFAELQLRTLNGPGSVLLQQRLETLAHSPFRNSLNRVVLDHVAPFEINGVEVPLDLAHALQPLYAVPHIRHFTIRGSSLLANARLALRDIAHAWPELEALALISHRDDSVGAVAGCITLEDLVQLPRRCPRLRRLELHLHAETVPDAATLARLLPEPSQSPLRGPLVVHSAPIVDADRVADFLAHLFPALDDVSYEGAVEGSIFGGGRASWVSREKWEKVGRLLKESVDSASEVGRVPQLH